MISQNLYLTLHRKDTKMQTSVMKTTTTFRTIIATLMLCLCLGAWAEGSPLAKNNKRSRTVKRPKIGLVLGGGGAKGAAEVGVLKYIEQSGVKIDYIAGTSIGSIIGALYSIGYRSDDLDTLFHSQEWLALLSDRDPELSSRLLARRDSATYLFGFPIKRPKITKPEHKRTVGLSRGDSIVSLFSEMTRRPDSINFDKLPIPFRCVTVDLQRLKEVVLSNGSLPLAMRASMSIPGVFKPVEKDSMLLVDGGLLNNLPVDVVKSMGADKVIAIDLTQNKHEKRKQKSEGNTDEIGKKGRWKNLVTWFIKRPDLDKYKKNAAMADVYINPDLKGFSAADFSPKKIDEMIRRGETAGKEALDQLKKLKNNK